MFKPTQNLQINQNMASGVQR